MSVKSNVTIPVGSLAKAGLLVSHHGSRPPERSYCSPLALAQSGREAITLPQHYTSLFEVDVGKFALPRVPYAALSK